MAIQVRDAGEDDIPAILAIFNQVVATSTAIYRDLPFDLDDRLQWWSGRVDAGYPVLVADDGGEVVGVASFGDFRTWPGYRFTVEHSVHVRDDRRGHGIGTLLMQPLIERAVALGKHVMVGGIDAGNAASLRFHQRLGFEPVAHMREVGFKFDRWLDLVFVERIL